MSFNPPSTTSVYGVVSSLLRPADGDRSERSIRCQLVYNPAAPSYTLWVRSGIREAMSAALATELGRPFEVNSDYWTLELKEVESLLASANA
jgi:hypothetical protein